MSIWGKIMGGAAGFAIGGPLGALLGTVAGHAVDRLGRCGPATDSADSAEGGGTKSIVFTIGVVVLAAKLAKVDGIVQRVEVEAFKRTFRVSPEELKNVGRVFDLARRDSQGFEIYARQIAELFHARDAVLEELLESLLRIAEADGEVHEAELGYLRDVATIFGFTEADMQRILAEHCALCGRSDTDPYAVLGVPRDADEDAVKTAYRRLVQEHHPDRLMAQGLPQEFLDLASEKMAAINAAYTRIRKERQPA